MLPLAVYDMRQIEQTELRRGDQSERQTAFVYESAANILPGAVVDCVHADRGRETGRELGAFNRSPTGKGRRRLFRLRRIGRGIDGRSRHR